MVDSIIIIFNTYLSLIIIITLQSRTSVLQRKTQWARCVNDFFRAWKSERAARICTHIYRTPKLALSPAAHLRRVGHKENRTAWTIKLPESLDN